MIIDRRRFLALGTAAAASPALAAPAPMGGFGVEQAHEFRVLIPAGQDRQVTRLKSRETYFFTYEQLGNHMISFYMISGTAAA